jgi:uncharacterized protein with NRDE domain
MCTILAAVKPWPGVPLLVAANRDEMLARPASPPFLWPGAPRIVAPRDDRAGGSWLGLNEHGLFVGITNRARAALDASRLSRGALVMDALRARSAAALHDDLARLDPGAYNPFHLFYADRASAHLTWTDGVVLHRSTLEPGLHVITERSFGAGDGARVELLQRLWEETGAPAREPAMDRIEGILARHASAEDPFAATCIHADAFGYGTRSSLVLRLGESWAETRARWAEGKPCVTPFVELGPLVAELAAPRLSS